MRMQESEPARALSGTGVPAIDAALDGFGQTTWQAESAAQALTERAATLLRHLAEGTLDTDKHLADRLEPDE
ncbi:hypothetical protein AB0I53_29160 [Saccharopolyspora sp. NPDC050389]|uniref:hypothetical protein n=1 Tax=Saccharopolyspora sp. NPDC050389 TaxID=3155516 RepID=UPI0033D05804